MRKVLQVPTFLGLTGMLLMGAEKPPADYQKAMQDLGAFSSGIDKAVEAEDYDAVAKMANSAKDAFNIVVEFWAKRTDGAANQAAQDGLKTAADLGVTANLKSKEGAAYSAMVIKQLCAGCHMAHRDRQSDGTFQ